PPPLKFALLFATGSTITPRRPTSPSAFRAPIPRGFPSAPRPPGPSHPCLDTTRRDIFGSAFTASLMRWTTPDPNHWLPTHTRHSYRNPIPVSSLSARQPNLAGELPGGCFVILNSQDQEI